MHARDLRILSSPGCEKHFAGVRRQSYDLLDLLLAARDAETGRGMNEAELVANLLTFISAGHETTAVALTWTLWLLAKDEAIQRRVYDEVVAVIGHGPVEIAHIDALPLTRQAILEAMRLFP